MRDAAKLGSIGKTAVEKGSDSMKDGFIKHAAPMMAVSLIAGLVLSILAPYGTSTFSLPVRFIYWVGLAMAGGVGATMLDMFARKKGWTLTSWQRALGQSVGATLVVSVILLGFTMLTYGWPGWVHFLTMPFFIWVISILICGIGELVRSRKGGAAVEPQRPDIMERLKPALRRSAIYALSSEDHYVRVITAAGDDLILMRLSDAIKETAPLKGLQIHRSYWVAEAGIDKVLKQDGKLSVRLKNGTTAPVSRNKSKSLREAGWV